MALVDFLKFTPADVLFSGQFGKGGLMVAPREGSGTVPFDFSLLQGLVGPGILGAAAPTNGIGSALPGIQRGEDIFPATPGFQSVRGRQAVARAAGKAARGRLRKDQYGKTQLFAVDPRDPGRGLQSLPAGSIPSDYPKDWQLFGITEDTGDLVPIIKRRRRMNPSNHRAVRRSIRRVLGAERHAQKLFRVAKKIKKTVKKRKRAS